MQAKSKQIEEKPAAYTESKSELLSMKLPPPKAKGRIVGEGKEAVPELVRILREEAKVI
jgi:electron transfer flavoprotein beta subunit